MGERLFQTHTTELNVNFTAITTQYSGNLSLFSEATGSIPVTKYFNKSIDTGNTDKKLFHNSFDDEPSNGQSVVIFERRKHRNRDAILTTGTIGFIFVLTICVGIIYQKRQHSYQPMENNNSAFNYTYKPLKAGILDDEYESTFVGVDVPLLQEISVI